MKKFRFILVIIFCLLLIGCDNNNDKDIISSKTFEIHNIIANIDNTKKIIVEDNLTNETIKEITNENEINNVLNDINKFNTINEVQTKPLSNWSLLMLDDNDSVIVKILLWESGYISFNTDKEYGIYDTNILNNLIDIINS